MYNRTEEIMVDFILNLAKTVATQLIGVLGIFFVFGFALSKVEDLTHRIYHRSIGWRGILWTAWIGTPIHEVGHVVFAKLFRHRIDRVSIFGPNQKTGGLGFVDHSYNTRSIYQNIGNFFIGAAPMIFGGLFLVIILYLFVPNGRQIFSPLLDISSAQSALTEIKLTLARLFSYENMRLWNFWLFIYISFCISSHLAPSKRDRAGMWSGLVWIIILLVLTNIIATLIHFNLSLYIGRTDQFLTFFIAIYSYALMLSIIHLVVATIVLTPFRKK